ncbi:MAG: ABC transporter permease [Vicinamibacteraceae bacterium]
MRTTRLLTHSLRAMARYRLRSTFMMLGSLVGVAALTVAVSVGQGMQAKVLTTLSRMLGEASILVMAGGGRHMGGPRAGAAGAARMTIDDQTAVAEEGSEVEDWDPQQNVSTVVRYRDTTATVRVLGQSERGDQVWARTVTRGQYFDAAAVRTSARVAVIGETVARTLFGREDPLDAELRIGAVPFRVIGLLEPFGTDMHGMDLDNEIVVPISTLMRRVTNVDTIAAARVLVKDPARQEETAREIEGVLRARHGLVADQLDDFRVATSIEVRRNMAWIGRVLGLYLPLVAGIVLLVAGIVAATLMLSSVSERVGEIGLRRAVGARPEDIRLQFATETVATILSGGVGGLLLGYVGAQIVARRLQLGEIFSWEAVLVGIAASAVTGLLAGVLPARRAAQLHPADALR